MSAAPITQDSLRARLGDVLTNVQHLWDVPNPGAREDRIVGLLLFVLSLNKPEETTRLNTVIKLITSDGEKGDLLKLLADTDDDSPEFDLVKFILGGTDMPAWEDIAAKVLTLAVDEAKSASPVTPSRPVPTPPPATSVPTPPAPSPTDLLGRLFGTSTTPVDGTTTVPPVVTDPAGTPDPQQPADAGGNGDGRNRRQRRRAARGGQS